MELIFFHLHIIFWERATNENISGLLREYFPKGEEIGKYSEEYVPEVFKKLNLRAGKVLGYMAPYEVYYSKKIALGLTICRLIKVFI